MKCMVVMSILNGLMTHITTKWHGCSISDEEWVIAWWNWGIVEHQKRKRCQSIRAKKDEGEECYAQG